MIDVWLHQVTIYGKNVSVNLFMTVTGMDEELNTPFYEHVFLDKHLTAFPSTGPVRRFMQLVVLGLSKNPHLSVKEKVAHINWFEDYFREKQPLVTTEQLLADSKSGQSQESEL